MLHMPNPETPMTIEELDAALPVLPPQARSLARAMAPRLAVPADPHLWEEFGSFLFDHGFLVDSSGKVLSEEPDWSEYFTNEYLG